MNESFVVSVDEEEGVASVVPLPRDPSIRDVLAVLERIEAKLDAVLSSDGSMMAP